MKSARTRNKILKEFAESSQSKNKLFDTNTRREEIKTPIPQVNKIISSTVSHNISTVTNNELDEYLKHKNRSSDLSENKSKELMNLNISPRSGFESNTFEKTQNTAENPAEPSETPILFLDVNFGNDKLTRIVMYKGKA